MYICIHTYIRALYVYLLFKFRIIHGLYPVIPVFNSFIFFNAKPTAVLAFSMAFPEVRAMTQLATKCKLVATSVRKDPCWTALWKDVSVHCHCWNTYLLKLKSNYFRILVSSPEAHWNFISPCSSHQPARNKTKQNRVVFSHVFTAARSTKRLFPFPCSFAMFFNGNFCDQPCFIYGISPAYVLGVSPGREKDLWKARFSVEIVADMWPYILCIRAYVKGVDVRGYVYIYIYLFTISYVYNTTPLWIFQVCKILPAER